MQPLSKVAALVLMAVAASVIALLLLGTQMQPLTRSELALPAPRPPAQPTEATLRCEHGKPVHLTTARGADWSSTVWVEEPCRLDDDLFYTVEATASELVLLKRRPQISFQVGIDGQVNKASATRSSGVETLDRRALKLVVAHRYRPHECGVCWVSSVVNIDFNGPVWVRESAE